MSQRVAPWPLFNPGGRRTDEIDETQSGPKRPELKLVKGGAAPRLERMTPRVRLVSLMVMVAVVLFAVVMCHVLLSQGQFRLEALQKQANEQQDTYEKLRLQVAELESPARITNEAQTRLSWRRRGGCEVDLGCSGGGWVGYVKRGLVKPEYTGSDVARKGLNAVVVLGNRLVVQATLLADAVLRTFQLRDEIANQLVAL